MAPVKTQAKARGRGEKDNIITYSSNLITFQISFYIIFILLFQSIAMKLITCLSTILFKSTGVQIVGRAAGRKLRTQKIRRKTPMLIPTFKIICSHGVSAGCLNLSAVTFVEKICSLNAIFIFNFSLIFQWLLVTLNLTSCNDNLLSSLFHPCHFPPRLARMLFAGSRTRHCIFFSLSSNK